MKVKHAYAEMVNKEKEDYYAWICNSVGGGHGKPVLCASHRKDEHSAGVGVGVLHDIDNREVYEWQ